MKSLWGIKNQNELKKMENKNLGLLSRFCRVIKAEQRALIKAASAGLPVTEPITGGQRSPQPHINQPVWAQLKAN